MTPPRRRRPGQWEPPATLDAPVLTPRLRIRALEVADAGAYHALIDADRDRLLPWMGWAATTHLTEDETVRTLGEQRTARSLDPAANRTLGLFDLADATMVGALSVHGIDADAARVELGYWVATPFTRRGLATEAVRHVVSAALRPVEDGGWGLNKVHMRTAGANVAARGVPDALGLRREVRRRQHAFVEGIGVDDDYGWGVLADEWDVETMRMRRADPDPDVGVGPHPQPWPDGAHLDPLLLRDGDRRNVVDGYRYWRHEAIVGDLAARAHPFHIAIENWRHDMNIGTVVRNANAFGAAGVHVVGRRSWNRRGAMVTDRYLQIHHHDDVGSLVAWAADQKLAVIGIDNLPGSVSIFERPPPERCLMVMGQEGPGLTDAVRRAAQATLHVPQFGSTRSINAGVASGIAMAWWVQTHSVASRSRKAQVDP